MASYDSTQGTRRKKASTTCKRIRYWRYFARFWRSSKKNDNAPNEMHPKPKAMSRSFEKMVAFISVAGSDSLYPHGCLKGRSFTNEKIYAKTLFKELASMLYSLRSSFLACDSFTRMLESP